MAYRWRSEDFDEDYYERGVETGRSLYRDYRWLGEPTVEMARHMVSYLELAPGDRILDYGCAKGYLVKALRLLGHQAWGVDISAYAIARVDAETRPFCVRLSENGSLAIPRPAPCPPGAPAAPGAAFAGPGDNGTAPDYEVVISKDTLEHVPEEQLPRVLRALAEVSRRLFAIVPLGDGERFEVPDYERDPTHQVRRSLGWWRRALGEAGWAVERAVYRMPGIKDAWAHYPRGNGFFIGRRRT